MKKGRIHRRTAVIVVIYAVAVTAGMSFFALYAYTPLVFYTPILWIFLPLLVYAWLKNRRKKEDDLW